MRYTHAWGDTPWEEPNGDYMSDCSTEAWNAPHGIEGFAMCDNGDKLTLNYARYVGSHERKVLYFELDGVKFVPERTCKAVLVDLVRARGFHGYSESLECSECGKPLFECFNYCPNCGAKVRKVDE